jgi:hypothetical protein
MGAACSPTGRSSARRTTSCRRASTRRLERIPGAGASARDEGRSCSRCRDGGTRAVPGHAERRRAVTALTPTPARTGNLRKLKISAVRGGCSGGLSATESAHPVAGPGPLAMPRAAYTQKQPMLEWRWRAALRCPRASRPVSARGELDDPLVRFSGRSWRRGSPPQRCAARCQPRSLRFRIRLRALLLGAGLGELVVRVGLVATGLLRRTA